MEKQNIGQIKEQLKHCNGQNLQEFIKTYHADERTGVRNLVHSAQKKWDAYNKELERTEQMKYYEKKYSSYSYIAGIDEVGRGPLAGPVVACALILPKDCSILYIDDSKKLSPAKRQKLSEQIKECATYSIGMADHTVIDEINILNATYQAMREAISDLSVTPQLMLNDAVTIPGIDIKQVPIIKGDGKSISIAAASIVAKVTRDCMMEAYDKIYPEYDFAQNKGYGSAKHIAALKKYGPCPIHRRTFIKNFISV